MKTFGIFCFVFIVVACRPIEYAHYGDSKVNETLSKLLTTPTIKHVSNTSSVSYFTYVILGVFFYSFTLGLAFASGYYRKTFLKPQIQAFQGCYGYGDNKLKKKHQKDKFRVTPMSDWI
uniref:Uncharacterized protein n=1 Tax=Panagrellus redivivus TaxID=6233 RepID=A0A7E4VK14_PANRE